MHRIGFSFLLVLATGTGALAGGDSLFVSTLGSDTANDCLTASSPCRSLGHAASLAVSTDTIFVAGGSYQESVTFEDSGTLAIRGSYDEAFVASNPDNEPTVLRSKGTRPLTFLYNGGTGSLTIDGLTVSKSSSEPTFDPLTDQGGGIFVHAVSSAVVSVSLSDMTMEANKALAGAAFALIAETGAVTNLSITTSRFARNKGIACAAILVDAIDAPPAQVFLQDVVFEKNKASESAGAICTSVTDATLTESVQTFDRVTFLKNKATIGAGIFAFVIEGGHLDLVITNSVFMQNKAIFGAGLGALSLPSATVGADIGIRTVNNTITGNKAKQGGAGVVLQSSASIDLTSVDAAVVMDSTNDIVFGNKGGDVLLGGSAGTTARLEREYGIYGEDLVDVAGEIVDGAGMLSAAPNFVIPGKDAHLMSPSPAIDAGTCTGAPAVDFEGDARPDGGGCDIGADEF